MHTSFAMRLQDNLIDMHIKQALVIIRVDPLEWLFLNLIENNVLNSLAAAATIATVAGSAYKYFKDKNNEKIRASKNLHLELDDTLNSLDDKKFSDTFCHVDMEYNTGQKTANL